MQTRTLKLFLVATALAVLAAPFGSTPAWVQAEDQAPATPAFVVFDNRDISNLPATDLATIQEMIVVADQDWERYKAGEFDNDPNLIEYLRAISEAYVRAREATHKPADSVTPGPQASCDCYGQCHIIHWLSGASTDLPIYPEGETGTAAACKAKVKATCELGASTWMLGSVCKK